MENKGISLIVLVITIIVMIIIAGAVIVSLSSSNITNKAKDAVEKANLKSVQDAVTLAYADYKLNGETGSLSEYVKNWLITKNYISEKESLKYVFDETGKVLSKNSLNEVILSGTSVSQDKTYDDSAFLKIYGKSEQRNLPTEYQEVEYIESTGTQYIDIGVKWNTNNQKIIGKASFSQLAAGGGATISPSAKEGTSYFALTLRNSDVITNGRFLSGTTFNDFSFNLQLNTIYEYTIDKNVAYIDGIQVSLVNDFSNSNINMYEFARNSDGTPTLTQYKKIYYLKIYDSNILIRDMIPCYRKSDNVIGMYDIVNDVFYSNKGTGTFVKGSNTILSPDNPVEIKSVSNFDLMSAGRNLLNSNLIPGVYDNAALNTSLAIYRSFAYPVWLQAGTYTFGITDNAIRIVRIQVNGITTNIVSDNKYVFTLNQPSYVNFSFRNSSKTAWIYGETTALSKLQIQLGSTSTPYTPFRGIQSIHMPHTLRSLPDGTKDYIEIDNVDKTAKLYRNVGEVVFDGVTVGKKFTNTDSNQTGGYNYAYLFISVKSNSIPSCSHFLGGRVTYKKNNVWTTSVLGLTISDTITGVVSTDTKANVVSKINLFLNQQYAAGTPVTVQYQLATPVITNLDYEEIKTYYPYTNIYTTATVQPTLEAKMVISN